MVNLAAALKAELALAARKAAQDEASALERELKATRSEVQALRRQVEALERSIAALAAPPASRPARNAAQATPRAQDGTALRFSAKGFANLRERLGLSAADMGALIGVTAQSVYKWEDGKSHPRAAQLRAIAKLRELGKREAAARLADLGHS
ncbi:MAG TPA: helix-turn-helix transcriptional regulator [Ramlibacter sp.]|nr:helix-turn-helix transcriptional regulator [Ramlibacter sp.]